MSSLNIPGPTALFHAIELQYDSLATGAAPYAQSHGSHPHGALRQLAYVAADTEILMFSDHGYVSDAAVPYPPLLSQAFAIDRRLDLVPSDTTSAETFGQIIINNPGGSLNDVIASRVVDHLPVKILAGRKTIDAARGVLIDPPYAQLVQTFGGLATSWQPTVNSVALGLLDPSYWLAGTMQVATYGGTGSYDGDSNTTSRNKPRLRGPVLNIVPVLIDTANLVYQVSDGPATITAIYEGGYAGGIALTGSVSNIYASAPAAGHYTVQSGSSGTYFRLGTKPVYAITADATGTFPSGSVVSRLLNVARQMLLEDLAIPAAYIDPSWIIASGAAAGMVGGWYWDGSAVVTGQNVLDTLLSGLGIRVIPTRLGTLRPVQLAAPAPGSAARLILTTDEIVTMATVALDAALDPPAYRWRVGYMHNFTLQAAGSSLHPQATAARQAIVALSDRIGAWFSSTIKAAYRQPNDPPVLITALANSADAITVAGTHGALWGSGRRIWAVTLPKQIAYQCDLGDTVAITFPVGGLEDGALGLVIGEQTRSGDPSSTLQVLV